MKRNHTPLVLSALLTLGLSAPLLAQEHGNMDHDKMSHEHAADSSQPGTDTWITTKVKADLLASGKTPGTDISVETKNGVVWLSGHVATKDQKDRAITEARGIEGVKKVEAGKLMVGKKDM